MWYGKRLAYPPECSVEPALEDQGKLRGCRCLRLEVLEHGRALVGQVEEVRVHDLTLVRQLVHIVGRRNDDAEIEARAPQPPEEIAVLRRARGDTVAARGHDSHAP